MEDGGEGGGGGGSSGRLKKKKPVKRKRGPGRPPKASYEQAAEAADAPAAAAASASVPTKAAFEKEKKEILKHVPSNIQSLFGDIGFAKFGKKFYLVLVLNPFHVPPHIRSQWLTMYEKLKRVDGLSRMSLIVYWYESTDPESFYGYVPQKDFIPFEQGEAKGHLKAYKSAVTKCDEMESLSKKETDKALAMIEVEEDLPKAKEDRRRGITEFPEEYEIAMREVKAAEAKESEPAGDDNDAEGEAGEEPAEEPPKKKKRGRPPKSAAENADKPKKKRGRPPKKKPPPEAAEEEPGETPVKMKDVGAETAAAIAKAVAGEGEGEGDVDKEDDSDDNDSVGESDATLTDTDSVKKATAEAKKRSAAKRKRKKEPQTDEGKDDDEEKELEDEEEKSSSKKKKPPKEETETASEESGSEKNKAKTDDDEEEEAELPSPKQKKKRKKSAAEDDEDEEDEPPVKASPPKKKKRGPGRPPKKPKPEDDDDDEPTPKKKKRGPGRPPKSAAKKKAAAAAAAADEDVDEDKLKDALLPIPEHYTDAKKKEFETRNFRRCEKYYGPLIATWRTALSEDDLKSLESCLGRATRVVNNFSAPFMELYLVSLFQKTKTMLGNNSKESMAADLMQMNKKLKGTIKKLYAEKKKALPADYTYPEAKLPMEDEAKAAGGDDDDSSNAEDKKKKEDESDSKPAAKEDTKKEEAVKEAKTEDDAKDTQKAPTPAPAPSKEAKKPPPDLKVPLSKKGAMSRTRGAPAPAPAPAPPPKRGFSLGTLTKMAKQQPKPEPAAQKESKLPKWLIEKPPTAAVPSSTAAMDIRTLGLDFLKDMALQFPAARGSSEENKINVESVAHAFDKALWAWASKQQQPKDEKGDKSEKERISDLYWERLHAIVAAICGKTNRSTGTLMHLILNGEYPCAERVVDLNDADLTKSFEGHPFV